MLQEHKYMFDIMIFVGQHLVGINFSNLYLSKIEPVTRVFFGYSAHSQSLDPTSEQYATSDTSLLDTSVSKTSPDIDSNEPKSQEKATVSFMCRTLCTGHYELDTMYKHYVQTLCTDTMYRHNVQDTMYRTMYRTLYTGHHVQDTMYRHYVCTGHYVQTLCIGHYIQDTMYVQSLLMYRHYVQDTLYRHYVPTICTDTMYKTLCTGHFV